MKKCTQCEIEKCLDEFHSCKKGKQGRKSKCKDCIKIETKKYYENNIEYYKNYRLSNSDKIREIKRIWAEVNNERVKLKQGKWRKDNSSHIKEYRLLNSEKTKVYNKDYFKNRRYTDPLFKLTTNIRNRIKHYIKTNNITKNNKTFDIVGCSPEFLKEHIEKQFTEGMSWTRYGKEIHIDHKIPLSMAKTEEEVYKLCHYTNLQPLWAEDNLKKNNRII